MKESPRPGANVEPRFDGHIELAYTLHNCKRARRIAIHREFVLGTSCVDDEFEAEFSIPTSRVASLCAHWLLKAHMLQFEQIGGAKFRRQRVDISVIIRPSKGAGWEELVIRMAGSLVVHSLPKSPPLPSQFRI
ncbi:hypothetical protein ACTXT7_005394 [Hymenolepis weldensis]